MSAGLLRFEKTIGVLLYVHPWTTVIPQPSQFGEVVSCCLSPPPGPQNNNILTPLICIVKGAC